MSVERGQVKSGARLDLITNGQKSPRVDKWTRAQKRLYHRMLSGLQVDRGGTPPRLMTLTSVDNGKDIEVSWEILKKRIRRRFGSFEYIKVRELTKRGLPHLHVLFFGAFIPHRWLMRNWYEIHGAKVVDIRSRFRLRVYVKHIVRYFTKEFCRYSWSWGWVYRGFVKSWELIRRRFGKNALRMWLRHLARLPVLIDPVLKEYLVWGGKIVPEQALYRVLDLFLWG